MECLRLNTDGKIYVENERARLTLRLSLLHEKNGTLNTVYPVLYNWRISGELGTAASIINELHVETYGTMDRKEKVEFILEQMRLTINNKDFVRAQIISKVIFFIEKLENYILFRKYQPVILKKKLKTSRSWNWNFMTWWYSLIWTKKIFECLQTFQAN